MIFLLENDKNYKASKAHFLISSGSSCVRGTTKDFPLYFMSHKATNHVSEQWKSWGKMKLLL